jgi:hypothetical protein
MPSVKVGAALLFGVVLVARSAAAQPAATAAATPAAPLEQSLDRALAFVPVGSTPSVELGVRDLIRSVLTSQLATFPTGSSSGAFTYGYDERTRAFSRRSRTFGPWFAESASSLGRAGAFSMGTSVQMVSFKGLDGRELNQGVFHSRSKFGTSDWVGRRLNMSLTNQTISVFGTYAVAPTVDIGVLVPVVRVGFEASAVDLQGRILTDDSLGSGTIPHTAAAHLGDIQPRAKWNLARSRLMDGAVQVDFRLPTGSARNLTGTGSARQKFSGLLSFHHGSFEEHVNVGYTFRLSGVSPGSVLYNNIGYDVETAEGTVSYLGFENVDPQGSTSNELSYVFAADWAAHAKATVTMEVVGRYMRDGVAFEAKTGSGVTFFSGVEQYDYIQPVRANINQVLFAVGGKFNIARSSLISAHVIASPSEAGLTIRPALVFGFEHAF